MNTNTIEAICHNEQGCTGTWRRHATKISENEVLKTIRCSKCDAQWTDTFEHRTSAIDENNAGVTLYKLTKEGKALIGIQIRNRIQGF